MTGWTKSEPRVPQKHAENDVSVSVGEVKGVHVLRVRVPVAIAETYAIDKGDGFDVFLDGGGRRLRFTYETNGKVIAKGYVKGDKKPKALTFVLSMLRFDETFAKTAAPHDKVDGDLVVTLPAIAQVRR